MNTTRARHIRQVVEEKGSITSNDRRREEIVRNIRVVMAVKQVLRCLEVSTT